MKVKLLAGIILMGFSGVMGFQFFNAGMPGTNAAVTGLILTAVLPGFGGLAFLFYFLKQLQHMKRRRELIREQNLGADIIRLADRKGGKLTIFEVMAEFNLNSETAEQSLNGLITKRLARRIINEAGAFIYVIDNIRRLPRRQTSQNFVQRRLA
jgi:hypothetical protein